MVKLTNALKDYSVVILSAGMGRRMGKIGKKIPKSLCVISKKTIISDIILKLRSRGLKELNIILGYKHKMILDEINNFRNLKINYVKIKDFKKNGSVFSFYNFHKIWKKSKIKKPVIMLHSDIIFDLKFLDNLILSKKQNIIGVRKVKKKELKPNSFVIEADKRGQVNKIGKSKSLKNSNMEIICINKFSSKCFIRIINFLKEYFLINGTDETWEYPLSTFLNKKKEKIFSLRNQTYNWINVNSYSDLIFARNIYK
tara:strand:+ start:1592 stop:2359 length:768 start_codon:yes stop_codon:yes gene_type:complete